MALPKLAISNRQSLITVRPYQKADRPAVRLICGTDEFARPELFRQHRRMGEYLADKAIPYYDYEPESTFVGEVAGQVVGVLWGTVDTRRCEQRARQLRPLLIRRCLAGTYGWPVWVLPDLRTDLANRHPVFPQVDLHQYPAHLHIGVLPAWRRQGIGTALVACYADYLRHRSIPGFHLYASSFHPLGVAFYRKLRLEELGQFAWRFHTGVRWLTVTERIFGLRLGESGLLATDS